MEFEEHDELYHGQFDFRDAFYQMEIPSSWWTFFGVPAVRAKALGLRAYQGTSLLDGTPLVLRFKVVPVGWTHALCWCQTVHIKSS